MRRGTACIRCSFATPMAPLFIPDTDWPETASAALALQKDLRDRVAIRPFTRDMRLVAGIDVSHDRAGNSHAAVAVIDMATLATVETARLSAPTRFPYVPGLLSFREIPVILQALARLTATPDVLMVDGQGIAHPRGLGIAAHLGVLLDMPAVGVAKSRLWGHHAPVGPHKGDCAALTQARTRIGTVLRSKVKCLPLYISPGHLMDQEQALALTLAGLTQYRLPEPTRIADKISKKSNLNQHLI